MTHLSCHHVSLALPLHAHSLSDDNLTTKNERLVQRDDGKGLAVQALKNITFELNSGDRLGLFGRNGAGKTSLLQVLAGIYPPAKGEVRAQGKATNLININVGMQIEATGHKNITLRGLIGGHTRAQIEEKREDIARFSELGEFLNLPLASYSAGMRMRLNFAIATAFDPEILILDEWISAGDEQFRAKASQRMREFVDKAGILVLASHSRNLLTDNCNLGLWLDDGHIGAFGPIEETLAAYTESSQGKVKTPV